MKAYKKHYSSTKCYKPRRGRRAIKKNNKKHSRQVLFKELESIIENGS